MSEDQLKSFLEAIKADSTLQERLKAVKDAESIVSFAKEAGYAISMEDLNLRSGELSEEELELVCGGVDFCIIGGALTFASLGCNLPPSS